MTTTTAPDEMLWCSSCKRDVVTGRAASHEDRFHGGSMTCHKPLPIILRPDTPAWDEAERRLAIDRRRHDEGMRIALAGVHERRWATRREAER